MDYLKLLEHSYEIDKANEPDGEMSRLEYLSRSIFDFTTYHVLGKESLML